MTRIGDQPFQYYLRTHIGEKPYQCNNSLDVPETLNMFQENFGQTGDRK